MVLITIKVIIISMIIKIKFNRYNKDIIMY